MGFRVEDLAMQILNPKPETPDSAVETPGRPLCPFCGFTVNSKKLEHPYPHAQKVYYRESRL